MIKHYLKSYGYLLISIITLTFIITLFNYFGLFSSNITNIFKLLIPIISLFVTALMVGKKASKRGLLEGLKYGGIFIIGILIINNLILGTNFQAKILIYYLILLVSSMIGSMIGINQNKGE